MESIHWPEGYLPGLTDNFISAETIVAGLSAEDVFPYLANAFMWHKYYDGASNVKVKGSDEAPVLKEGLGFTFSIIGFDVEAEVVEFVEPKGDKPGRVSWHGWVDGDADHRFDALHGFLFENLSEGRVRILTQESELGKPAAALAQQHPSPLLIGFQAWLDGMTDFAKRKVKIEA
jgi:hypothetical protein